MLVEKLLATLNNMLLSVTAIMLQQQKLPTAWRPLEEPFYWDQNKVRMRKGITAHVRLRHISRETQNSLALARSYFLGGGITLIYTIQIIDLSFFHVDLRGWPYPIYPLLFYIRPVPLIDAFCYNKILILYIVHLLMVTIKVILSDLCMVIGSN